MVMVTGICMYVYVCICVYVCMHAWCVFVRAYMVGIHACWMYIFMCGCICMPGECMYAYAHVNVCVCLHGVCTGCMGVCVHGVCVYLCVCMGRECIWCVCAFVERITAKEAEGTSSPPWVSALPSRSSHS